MSAFTHFIRVKRADGASALIHPSMVFAIYQNTTQVHGKPVECLSVVLQNNVTWHLIGETEASLLSKLAQGMNMNVHVITEARPEDLPRPPVEDASLS